MTDPNPTPHTSTLLYLCGVSSSITRATSAFVNRGLNKYTVGRLSQIQALGKPNEAQFAFGGYKNSIEHFVAATANKVKYLTSAESVPLPSSYIPSVPLPLPPLVVRIGEGIKPDLMAKLTARLSPEGLSPVKLGGTAGTAFEILNPSWSTVYTVGLVAFQKQCGRLDGRAQFGDLLLFKPIYQFIDAFLATNTYPYKKSDYSRPGNLGLEEKDTRFHMEFRAGDGLWRPGFGAKAPKKIKLTDADAIREMEDPAEPVDLTPQVDSQLKIHQIVPIAKPSPLPSSTSWGTPSSVPALGGLLFPYFNGMLQHDLPGTRDIIGRLMFRCLGDEKTPPRQAYANIRSSMGSVLNTEAGLILGHVLKGMDLALDCQAQLYLLFDGKTYLGFCLLGEEFQVWLNGKWNAAETPEQLRSALATLATAEQALEQLAAKIGSMSVGMDGLDSITAKDLATSTDILGALSRLTIADDEAGERITKDLYTLVGKCNMSGNYLSITPENVKWAIEQMTSRVLEPFPKEKHPIYIPPSGWQSLYTKQYTVLASFGPRSFSFRNSRGDEMKIADPKDETAKWNLKEGKMEQFGIYLYVKTVTEALADWQQFVETGKVRIDYKERAGTVRAHKWVAANKKTVWECLWANKDKFGIGAPAEEETAKTAKGKKKANDVAGVDFDALAKLL